MLLAQQQGAIVFSKADLQATAVVAYTCTIDSSNLSHQVAIFQNVIHPNDSHTTAIAIAAGKPVMLVIPATIFQIIGIFNTTGLEALGENVVSGTTRITPAPLPRNMLLVSIYSCRAPAGWLTEVIAGCGASGELYAAEYKWKRARCVLSCPSDSLASRLNLQTALHAAQAAPNWG